MLFSKNKNVHTAKKTSAALARPCLLYRGWPNTKEHPLRRACCRVERPRSVAVEVQRCVQERHESTEHKHKFLGGSRSRSHQLEKHASKAAADW